MPRVTWRKDGRLLPLHGSNRYEALQVGDTETWVSDHATLHISRCFGVPGAETALSLHEELRSVPTSAQQTRATCGCNGICHLPCRLSLCVAARPCRLPMGLPCSPSPGCSSCQAAPCKSTPFRSRIRAITSAWHPALPAPTGKAWTSMCWVSRRARRIPPGLTPLQPTAAGLQRCAAVLCSSPPCPSAVPPSITPGPFNLTLLAQQPATLGCDAWGSPEPHIRWEKDGRPLNPHLLPGAYRYLQHRPPHPPKGPTIAWGLPSPAAPHGAG